MAKDVNEFMLEFNNIKIDVEYRVVVKSTNNLNEVYREVFEEWNPKESVCPPIMTLNDLIIVRDSQDLWHLNVEEFVQSLYKAIIGNGFLLMVFQNWFTEPELALNSVLNINNGINDSDLKNRINCFKENAKKVGFNLICRKSDSIGTMALLFRKVIEKPKIPQKSQIIEINNKYENWFELLKDKIVSINNLDNNSENIWLIANESSINGIIGLINCLRLEPGGENCKCILDFDNTIQTPIDWNSKSFSDILINDLPINVIKKGKLGTYRHLKLPKDFDKTVSNEYFLNVGQNRDLSSLQWFDARTIATNSEDFDLNNNKIETILCHIYSSGLAFRDVMLAIGQISSDSQTLFTDCVIGCEFSGRRSDNGERVMGFGLNRCFANSISANKSLISPIPEHWSMEEAVTTLTTYSTIWYGLIKRANIQKNESILIHSGAGGVGQAAINVCQHYNCDIYTTVGTEAKKRFLMTEYGIPENRIFSSRDIRFKHMIMESTEGRGVDLVLNSLAGEKLEQSYECLAYGGRFVELGKVDLMKNKQMGMFDFLKDISFIGVSFDVCLREKPQLVEDFFIWLHKNCMNGCVNPLNRNVFNANEAEKAFRYMTIGKHIGKVVIRLRDEELDRKVVNAVKPAIDMLSTTITYFNPNKVYIITGGLGGFGLELVHWMLFKGAKKFVLTSRVGVRTDYQKYVINRLKAFGKCLKSFETEIIILTIDCTTIEGTKQLLRQTEQFGPIGGVFHSALVLKDSFFINQNLKDFCETIDCKYKTFANLDQLTRELSYNLDYFMVFSSVSCGKGTYGQSNYGFGNSVCERICEQRRADGLHGLAVQFGPIGDVGVFADITQTVTLTTLSKQRINSCCDVLDKLLAVKQPIVTSFIHKTYDNQVKSKQNILSNTVWNTLGINPDNTPEDLTVGEIGLGSMFAVKLQQLFEKELKQKISINTLKSLTIKMIKDYVSGNVDIMRNYLSELKQAQIELLKFKFLIPYETHTRLNDVKSGKPVYLMPPLETTFSAFEELAKSIDRPVIGLNWSRDLDKYETMEAINQYFMDLLSKLSPKGDYDLIGYFDSALMCAELIRKGMAGKAVIVDILSDSQLKDDIITNEILFEFIFSYLTTNICKSLKDKIRRDIESETDLNAKIRRFSEELKDLVGIALIGTDLEQIIRIICKRGRILTDYRRDRKLKLDNSNVNTDWSKTGKLALILPNNLAENMDKIISINKIAKIYFLPNHWVTMKNVSFETVNANTIPFALQIFKNTTNFF